MTVVTCGSGYLLADPRGPPLSRIFFHFHAHLGLVPPTWEIVVADPGFPKRVWGEPQRSRRKPIILAISFEKLHRFGKNWKRGAGDT